MFDRFSDRARRTVELAREESRRLGHTQIGTEHLLLGILADGHSFAARALTSSGASLDGSRPKVAEAVSAKTLATGSGGGTAREEFPFTDRARRALERASRLSLRRRAEQVSTEHVLLSVLDVEGTAGQVLRGLGVDMVGLRDAVDSAIGAEPGGSERDGAEPVGPAIVASRPAGGTSGPATPRCAGCGRSLDTVLAHRAMLSRTTGEGSRQFVVAYCSACGRPIAASRT